MTNLCTRKSSAPAALFLTCLLSTSCSPAKFEPSGEAQRISSNDRALICEPFSNDSPTDPRYGVFGEIRYLDDSQPRYTDVKDYKEQGQLIDADLFLNKIDVPTRLFNKGFKTSSGLEIRTTEGALLEEYFSLHLESSLALTGTESPGDYQLAIMSDDGAVVQVFDGTNYQTLIDNNGEHSTRIECAITPLQMKAGESINFKLDYFQGPRDHIALILLWRPWPTDPAMVNDPLCGTQTSYFDSSKTPSIPLPNWKGFISRGWRPLNTGNFVLPKNKTNRCVKS